MKKLVAAVAAAATLLGSQAMAAIATTIDIVGVVDISDPFNGIVGEGSVTFDEGLLFGFGPEEIIPALDPLFDFEFTIFDQTFSASDDSLFPLFPMLTFEDGMLEALDFMISEESLTNPVAIDVPGIISLVFTGGGLDADGTFIGQVFLEIDPNEVPLPAALPLFMAGLGAVGMSARRRRKA